MSPGQKALVLIGLGAIVLALLALTLSHARRGASASSVEYTAPQAPEAPATIAVHVVGAVRQPGLYYLAPGTRVSEAIAQAGGWAPEADQSSVNLAAYLQDGEQVKVAALASGTAPATPVVAATPPSPAAPATTPATPAGTAPLPASGKRPGPSLDLTRVKPISLSWGTQPELETLPDIGPQLAAAIVHYRTSHGPFRSVDDLGSVPGFGDGRVEALRPYVVP